MALERFDNLVEMFFARVGEKGDAPFLWRKADTAWTPLTWNEVAAQVASLAAGLKSLGLGRGDRVILVSENRPEWCIADLAIMAAGCVTVPAYTSNTERDHAHVVENSGACAAIVSTAKLAHTLLPALARSSGCDRLIAMEPIPGPQRVGPCAIHDWGALIAAHPADVAACTAGATFTREDLACIIYTSGTGGAPRGVMQHHGAILQNTAATVEVIESDFGTGDEVFLSLLPLSHAYEHSGGQFFPIGLGAQIYYAESIEKLAANIEEVRPTIMIVVPRLFELLRARILKAVEKQGVIPRWLFGRAVALGPAPHRWLDKPLDLLLDATVRRKIAARFGGRMKAMVSGGAPLNPEVGNFFASFGITLLQGYGQTEAGPIISCNRPGAGIRMNTVGPPLLACEVRIADDGEICVRGENVMHGYWRNEAESARVLVDGWLLTGDVGHFDEKGRITITDRKKDLIVNDKGDNVSPQRVEGMLTLEPEIAQAMVLGDRRPYLVGLIVPDAEWQAALPAGTDAAKAVMGAVDRVNRTLSVTERVRRIELADEPFTIENGALTPSLKTKRHVLRERYGARLDALYRQ